MFVYMRMRVCAALCERCDRGVIISMVLVGSLIVNLLELDFPGSRLEA